MKKLTFVDVKGIADITKTSLKKHYAISDLQKMLEHLEHMPAQYGAEITVANLRFTISPEEYPMMKTLIEACIEHLKCDIQISNEMIMSIIDQVEEKGAQNG